MPLFFVVVVQFPPSCVCDNTYTEKLVRHHRSADISRAGELSNRLDGLLKGCTTQEAQPAHLGSGQQHLTRDTVAIALNLYVGAAAAYAAGTQPQRREFMKHREGPRNVGVLVVDNDKRRNRVGNGVSSENVGGNICLIA